MFRNAAVLFLYAESPVHFGSGTSLGAIDLPIQRERYTQFPIGQASGIKGAMRDVVEQKTGVAALKATVRTKQRTREENQEPTSRLVLQKEIEALEEELAKLSEPVVTVFGPDRNAREHAGALAFKDARVLLFPVRSLRGVFAYVTCPTLMEGFKRDLKHVPDPGGAAALEFDAIKVTFGADESDRCAVSSTDLCIHDRLVLEDFVFRVKEDLSAHAQTFADKLSKVIFPEPSSQSGAIASQDTYGYWREHIRRNLVILHDDTFRDFTQTATEVLTRIKISDETGTAAEGALFTEEHLPSETVLYTLALATDAKRRNGNARPKSAAEIIATFRDWLYDTPIIQCGGDETVGRGLMYVHYWQGHEGMPTHQTASVQSPQSDAST